MPYTIDDVPERNVELLANLHERVMALIDRDDLASADEARVIVAEADLLDVPEMTTLARWAAFVVRSRAGDIKGAVSDYGGCLREISRHADFVPSDLRRAVLDSAQMTVTMMIGMPEISADTINRFLDALAREHQAHGVSTASVSAWRGLWAAERDDFAATRAHFEDYHATRRQDEEQIAFGLEWEIDAYAGFDAAFALTELTKRRGESETAQHAVKIESLQAWLESVTGDPAGGRDRIRRLIAEHGVQEVLDHAWLTSLLPVIDSADADPEEVAFAAGVAERLLADIDDEDAPREGHDLAVVARWHLRQDASSPEGRRLRLLAEAHAARFDARNGNDRHRRQLRELFAPLD